MALQANTQMPQKYVNDHFSTVIQAQKHIADAPHIGNYKMSSDRSKQFVKHMNDKTVNNPRNVT